MTFEYFTEMLENSMRQSVIDLCKSSVNIVVWLFFKLLHANFVRILTSSWLNSLQSPIHKFGSQFINNFWLITSLYKSLKLTRTNVKFIPRWSWVRIILIIEWGYRERLKERICRELFERLQRVFERLQRVFWGSKERL